MFIAQRFLQMALKTHNLLFNNADINLDFLHLLHRLPARRAFKKPMTGKSTDFSLVSLKEEWHFFSHT